jgi:hypothetical protein
MNSFITKAEGTLAMYRAGGAARVRYSLKSARFYANLEYRVTQVGVVKSSEEELGYRARRKSSEDALGGGDGLLFR